MLSLQVCKSAGLRVCKSAGLQVCKSAVCKSAVCMCRTPKGNRPFRPRFTCDFQIWHVICQIHLPYTGYFCPEVLLCKSSNEKRSEICIRKQFVTQMVRYGGEIENGYFDEGKDANVGLFWYAFVVKI